VDRARSDLLEEQQEQERKKISEKFEGRT